MLLREGWNFDDLNQSTHPCLSAKNEDSSKTENRSWKEHHGECSRWFLKRKMWLEKKHQEVFMTNYSLRVLKLHVYILLKISHYEETWFCCAQCHVRTICTDTHCWYARVLGHFFKSVLQCCPARALAWITQIRTRIHVCQCIIKTQARQLTGHGKSSKTNVCGIFLKRIM